MELISNDEKAFYWTGESDEKTITVVSISTNFELDSFKTPKLDTTTIRCIIPKTNESGTPTVIPETPAEETEAPTEEPTSQTEELNTSVKETEVKADEPENSATEAESTKETEETPEQENLPEN